MPIYKGTAPSTALGGYSNPTNPRGKSISLRQHHSLHNPTALKLQAAMRTAAARWQAMSGPERLTWYQWNWGSFIIRNGDLAPEPDYRGFLSHTLTQHFLGYPVVPGTFIEGQDYIETYTYFTCNITHQQIYAVWDNWGELTGSARSGASIYQIHPHYLDSPNKLQHTKLIASATPWFQGNPEEVLNGTIPFPVEHPTQLQLLVRFWDEHTMNAIIDDWSGPNIAEEPGYPEYCEGGATLIVTGMLLPCVNGWYYPRSERYGHPTWSKPSDAPLDSGMWIFAPDDHYEIWLERPWAQDARWSASLPLDPYWYYQPVWPPSRGLAYAKKF